MATLELEISAEVFEATRRLALSHYGDAGDLSITRVGEAAIRMRLYWLGLLDVAGQEVGEPVAEWSTESPATPDQAVSNVGQWLFGGS